MLILDTNILIAYLNDEEQFVKQLLNWRENSVNLFISVITEIEIFSLPSLTFAEIDTIHYFLREFTVIPLDSQLGKIAAGLRRRYRIKLGDSVIIATAKLTNFTLVTQDKGIISKAKDLVRIQTIA